MCVVAAIVAGVVLDRTMTSRTVHVVVIAEQEPSVQPTRSVALAPSVRTAALASSRIGKAGPRSAPPLKSSVLLSFRRFQATQPGAIGIAVETLAGSRVTSLGDDVAAHAWSTSKVPVLVALMTAEATQGLSAEQRAETYTAITESDNDAILALFGDLERLDGGLVPASLAVERVLAEAGDTHTVVTTAPPPPGAVTTFGQTEWSPSTSVRFFRALGAGCLLPPQQTDGIIDLMEHIEPAESWGLGSAHFAVPVAFKGGWGPESDGYLVRQSGIVDPGSSKGVAISIVAHPPAGADSFEVGTEMVTAAAGWLSENLVIARRPGRMCAVSGAGS